MWIRSRTADGEGQIGLGDEFQRARQQHTNQYVIELAEFPP